MPDSWCFLNEEPIEGKIRRAEDLRATYGPAMRQDPAIASLLQLYSREISKTWRLMHELDVITDCARCAAQNPGGSCCGSGIENWYDEFVLLINLLLWREIPVQRLEARNCLFLDTNGCKLLARHHFCVNYLCPHITTHLSPEAERSLRAQAGTELFLSWELERTLREWPSRHFARS